MQRVAAPCAQTRPFSGARAAPRQRSFAVQANVFGPLIEMFNKVTDKSAKTATLTKVNPALIDEILDVGRATDYGQKTTPEQRERLLELFDEIADNSPAPTMSDSRVWGEWRVLWASDNTYRGPFGKGPISVFYKVKDLVQTLEQPNKLINENFLAHVGFIPAQTRLEGSLTILGPKEYVVEFQPGTLQIEPGRAPPTIFGEVSYVDDRLRLLKGRRADADDDVPFTLFVFERIDDGTKGLPRKEREALQ